VAWQVTRFKIGLTCCLLLALAWLTMSVRPTSASAPRSAWQPVGQTHIPTHATVLSVAIAPHDSCLVYAGTYDDVGVYRSVNCGLTWAAIGPGRGVYDLYIPAAKPERIIAASLDGVWLSDDRGATWRHSLADQVIYTLAADDQGQLYCGLADGRVWVSTDWGESWAFLAQASESAVLSLWVDGGTIYAGTAGQGLTLSRDGGRTWQSIPALAGGYVSALLADGQGHLFARTRRALWRTSDGGTTWEEADSGLKGRVDALALGSHGALFAGTGGRGLYRSADVGRSWQRFGEGILEWAAIFDLAFADDIAYAGTWDGIYRSMDSGRSWQQANSGLGLPWANAFLADGQRLYLATFDGIYLSDDGGDSWQPASSNADLYGVDLNCLAQDDSGRLYGGAASGLYHSEDSGASWRMFPATGGLNIRGILPLRDEALLVRVAFARLYASADGGQTWYVRDRGFDPHTEVTSLAASPHGLYAGADDGLFFSADGGETWSRIAAELRGQSVLALHVDSSSGSLYAGTTRGLYRSTDGGRSWEATGLRHVTVTALLRQGHALYAGTKYRGVFRSEDDGSSWQRLSDSLTRGASIKALATQQGYLYAVTTVGLYRRALP
jgi:photosystem II stability/assembly factor-like uncharacterized protein